MGKLHTGKADFYAQRIMKLVKKLVILKPGILGRNPPDFGGKVTPCKSSRGP